MILSGTHCTSDKPNVHVSSFTQPKLTLAMANLATEVISGELQPGSKNTPQIVPTWEVSQNMVWPWPDQLYRFWCLCDWILYSPYHPCFYSNRWVLGIVFHIMRKSCRFCFISQEVVNNVSYRLPCLQCKLPCMFTNNNKEQSGWRE